MIGETRGQNCFYTVIGLYAASCISGTRLGLRRRSLYSAFRSVWPSLLSCKSIYETESPQAVVLLASRVQAFLNCEMHCAQSLERFWRYTPLVMLKAHVWHFKLSLGQL